MSYLENLGWPQNLYFDVFGKMVQIPEDFQDTITYVFGTLAPKETLSLIYIYKEFDTYECAGIRLGVTGQRIRQYVSRALKKLRHPARTNFLIYGISGALKMEEQKAEKIKRAAKKLEESYLEQLTKQDECSKGVADYNAFNETKTIELDLSVRAYNVLMRSKIYTLGDLVAFCMGGGDLLSIRNCGNQTRDEIVRAFERFTGIDFPVAVEQVRNNL